MSLATCISLSLSLFCAAIVLSAPRRRIHLDCQGTASCVRHIHKRRCDDSVARLLRFRQSHFMLQSPTENRADDSEDGAVDQSESRCATLQTLFSSRAGACSIFSQISSLNVADRAVVHPISR
jgi:hypothetical protein